MSNPEKLFFPAHSADRWLTCLASVREEKGLEDKTPDTFRTTGLAIHHTVEKWAADPGTPIAAGDTITLRKGKTHTLTDDDIAHAREYLDYIEMVCSRCGKHEIFTEQKLDVSQWTVPGQRVYVDTLIVDTDNKVIHVIDLKTGQGVQVEAYENRQLMLYAVAAVTHYEMFFGEFATVALHIVQPPRNHYDSFEMPRKSLISWADGYVAPTVQRIITGPQGALPYAPSDKACRFCKKRDNCRALADKALGTVADEFSDIVTPMEGMGSVPDIDAKNTASLTPEEIYRCLHNVDMITVWCKAIEARAQELLETQQAPAQCGYKLVRKRVQRQWIDDAKAEKALARAGLSLADRRQPMKPISPAQAEKKLGKKHAVLDRHVNSDRQGDITIARDSDKRAEVVLNITEGFENLE